MVVGVWVIFCSFYALLRTSPVFTYEINNNLRDNALIIRSSVTDIAPHHVSKRAVPIVKCYKTIFGTTTVNKTTVEACITHCWFHRCVAAMLKGGKKCKCLPAMSDATKVRSSLCKMPCIGNVLQNCGGITAYATYMTGYVHEPMILYHRRYYPINIQRSNIGCYNPPAAEAPTSLTIKSLRMTTSLCSYLCLTNKHDLAGVFNSDGCYCFHSVENLEETSMSKCSVRCAGKDRVKCGGPNGQLSVFKTGETFGKKEGVTTEEFKPPAWIAPHTIINTSPAHSSGSVGGVRRRSKKRRKVKKRTRKTKKSRKKKLKKKKKRKLKGGRKKKKTTKVERKNKFENRNVGGRFNNKSMRRKNNRMGTFGRGKPGRGNVAKGRTSPGGVGTGRESARSRAARKEWANKKKMAQSRGGFAAGGRRHSPGVYGGRKPVSGSSSVSGWRGDQRKGTSTHNKYRGNPKSGKVGFQKGRNKGARPNAGTAAVKSKAVGKWSGRPGRTKKTEARKKWGGAAAAEKVNDKKKDDYDSYGDYDYGKEKDKDTKNQNGGGHGDDYGDYDEDYGKGDGDSGGGKGGKDYGDKGGKDYGDKGGKDYKGGSDYGGSDYGGDKDYGGGDDYNY